MKKLTLQNLRPFLLAIMLSLPVFYFAIPGNSQKSLDDKGTNHRLAYKGPDDPLIPCDGSPRNISVGNMIPGYFYCGEYTTVYVSSSTTVLTTGTQVWLDACLSQPFPDGILTSLHHPTMGNSYFVVGGILYGPAIPC